MKENNTQSNLFTASGCVSREGVQKLHTGRLTACESEIIRQHLESCEFCRVAMEGLEPFENNARFEDAVDKINQALRKQLQDTPDGKKGKFSFVPKNYNLLKISASITLFIGIVALFNYYNKNILSGDILSKYELSTIVRQEKIIPPAPPGLYSQKMETASNVDENDYTGQNTLLVIESPKLGIKQAVSYEAFKNIDYPIEMIDNLLQNNQVIRVVFNRERALEEISIVNNSNGSIKKGIATVISSPKKLTETNKKELRRKSYSFPVEVLVQ